VRHLWSRSAGQGLTFGVIYVINIDHFFLGHALDYVLRCALLCLVSLNEDEKAHYFVDTVDADMQGGSGIEKKYAMPIFFLWPVWLD